MGNPKEEISQSTNNHHIFTFINSNLDISCKLSEVHILESHQSDLLIDWFKKIV